MSETRRDDRRYQPADRVPATRILFVCTGNICRSPTADGVLRKMVDDAGLGGQVQVDSAGTINYHAGHGADRRSAAAAERRGYDLSPLRARQIVPQDFAEFDVVIAMDEGHLLEMRRMRPEGAKAQLKMFRDYCTEHGPGDVPDPYYGGATGFEDVLELIEDGCRGLLDSLRAPNS